MSYQPQQSQPRKASWFLYLVLFVILLAVLWVCGASLYPQQFANFTRSLEPSCNIGLGTATVTVQSWSANKDCIAMLANADDFSGVNWGSLGFRSVSEPNTGGSIICERELSGRHLTVRDGAMSNNGAIACMEMDGSIIPFPG
jgi:hypothetical protein